MYIIDINRLKEGDILLITHNDDRHEKVRTASGSSFSHALLCVAYGSFIHSDIEGVHSGNIQRLVFESKDHIKVLRLKDCTNNDVIAKACNFARSEVGKRYSLKAAKKAIDKSGNQNNESNRQFCSRLVAQSFNFADIKLVENCLYCIPEDLNNREFVDEVGDCLRLATNEELAFAQSDNPINKQTVITNNILSSVRKLSGKDIQSFDQILSYLMEDSSKDHEITEVFRTSGYLELWKHDLQVNPWRYDSGAFLNIDLNLNMMFSCAKKEINIGTQAKERYFAQLQQYLIIYSSCDLEYALMQIELYSTLIGVCDLQIKTSMNVLETITKLFDRKID